MSQIFNQELTKDKKKKIDLSNLSNNHPLCSLPALVEATKDEREKSGVVTSPAATALRRSIELVHTYAPIADVFIQHQPHITAIVWGCVRFLIEVSVPLALFHFQLFVFCSLELLSLSPTTVSGIAIRNAPPYYSRKGPRSPGPLAPRSDEVPRATRTVPRRPTLKEYR
jgi:hypothetical protein